MSCASGAARNDFRTWGSNETVFFALPTNHGLVQASACPVVSGGHEFCRIVLLSCSAGCHAGADVPRQSAVSLAGCPADHAGFGGGRTLRLCHRIFRCRRRAAVVAGKPLLGRISEGRRVVRPLGVLGGFRSRLFADPVLKSSPLPPAPFDGAAAIHPGLVDRPRGTFFSGCRADGLGRRAHGVGAASLY